MELVVKGEKNHEGCVTREACYLRGVTLASAVRRRDRPKHWRRVAVRMAILRRINPLTLPFKVKISMRDTFTPPPALLLKCNVYLNPLARPAFDGHGGHQTCLDPPFLSGAK